MWKLSCLQWGRLVSEWHLHSHIAQAIFQLWGQLQVDLLASWIPINVSISTPWKIHYLWEPLGFNFFNHPRTISESCVSSCIGFPSSVQVSSRACYISIHTSYSLALCWMEAYWLPTILNMLIEIPHYCAIVKKLVMDVSVTRYSRMYHQCINLLAAQRYFSEARGSPPQSVR